MLASAVVAGQSQIEVLFLPFFSFLLFLLFLLFLSLPRFVRVFPTPTPMLYQVQSLFCIVAFEPRCTYGVGFVHPFVPKHLFSFLTFHFVISSCCQFGYL